MSKLAKLEEMIKALMNNDIDAATAASSQIMSKKTRAYLLGEEENKEDEEKKEKDEDDKDEKKSDKKDKKDSKDKKSDKKEDDKKDDDKKDEDDESEDEDEDDESEDEDDEDDEDEEDKDDVKECFKLTPVKGDNKHAPKESETSAQNSVDKNKWKKRLPKDNKRAATTETRLNDSVEISDDIIKGLCKLSEGDLDSLLCALFEVKQATQLSAEERSELVKKAKKGKDIGKPGKGFDKVVAQAKKYKAKDPEAVAAAAMWKHAK